MGGLSGHMLHPYEDYTLKINDLKDMVRQTLTGSINFIEKVDGFNIHFMVNPNNLDITYLRSNNDKQEGGICYSEIGERFSHNPDYGRLLKRIYPQIKSFVYHNIGLLEDNFDLNTKSFAVEIVKMNQPTNLVPYFTKSDNNKNNKNRNKIKLIYHDINQLLLDNGKLDYLKINPDSTKYYPFNNITNYLDYINNEIIEKFLGKTGVVFKDFFNSNPISYKLFDYYYFKYDQYIRDYFKGEYGYLISSIKERMFSYVFKMYYSGEYENKEYYTLKSIKSDYSDFLEINKINSDFIETLSKDKEFIKNLKRFVYKDIKETFRIIGDFVIDLVQQNPNNRGILLNDYFSEGTLNKFNEYYYNLTGKYGENGVVDFDKLYSENSDILLKDVQFNVLEGLVFQYEGGKYNTSRTYKYTGSFMLLNRYSKRFSK